MLTATDAQIALATIVTLAEQVAETLAINEEQHHLDYYEQCAAIWQQGRPTIIAVTQEGFVEGIADGAIHLNMHSVDNKIRITDNNDPAAFNIRALINLAWTGGDSYTYERKGDTLTNLTKPNPEIPWRVDVMDLIIRYFTPELLEITPEGIWQLAGDLYNPYEPDDEPTDPDGPPF